MNNCILAFDTSNYKTSAALFWPESGEWQSVGEFLPVKQGSLGLRQSDALFLHVKALPGIVQKLDRKGAEISAVACSDRPRDRADSYMPCFLAGASFAKSLAGVLKVPFYAFSHQHGHIASAAFSAGKTGLLSEPFLAWHLSGGTTELLSVMPSDGGFDVSICGGTTDISAGQLIDRAGVALSMPFPAGKYVEQAALSSDSRDCFKVKTKDSYFSLSGVENRIRDRIERKMPEADICAYVLNTVSDAVVRATEQARGTRNIPVLVSGGVSVCSFVRKAFSRLDNVFFAQNGLGGDNALGAALLCAFAENKL